ncbi:MAG: hypothetical protein CMM01_15615 [Rhodopirellula sp.]|nr:hypothetical protein [Rhodopirellula sp.]
MIREVRILEDKLYEADYKNRILAEKLKRARIEASEVPIHSAKPARRPDILRPEVNQGEPDFGPTPEPSTDGSADRTENGPEEDDGIGLSDLLPPTFDEGEPVAPDTMDINEPSTNPDFTEPAKSDPVPLTDPPASASPNVLRTPAFPDVNPKSPKTTPPRDSTPAPSPAFALPPTAGGPFKDEAGKPIELDSGTRLLDPAPGGPEPPGKRDTELPPVLPGEQLPPQLGSPSENIPPGKIQLPDSVKSNERVPDSLKIHPTLSGANRIDEKIQDMLLVVNVVNDLGKTISLDKFLIDGEMSIVVLDPQRESSMSRLGRWNFNREQVHRFVKDSPVSGFHIPLEWTMDEPLGSEVIVHVRLRAEDDEMRCEARLNLDKQRGVAGWLPRAESFR